MQGWVCKRSSCMQDVLAQSYMQGRLFFEKAGQD
jgi:hypothetical protein